MADPDKVWAAAKEVWDELPSATIAQGFLLAYRIAKKVVDNKGSNCFLQGKDGSLQMSGATSMKLIGESRRNVL
jgi:hypothetical protein